MGLVCVAIPIYLTLIGVQASESLLQIGVVDAAFAFAACLALLGCLAQRPLPDTAHLDDAGLTLQVGSRPIMRFEWEDPNLRLTVREWDSFARNGTTLPYRHEIICRTRSNTPVSEDLFSALISEASIHALPVSTRNRGSAFGPGFTDYCITGTHKLDRTGPH
jgi:hypothetical protein